MANSRGAPGERRARRIRGHEREPPVNARAREIARENDDRDRGRNDREEEIAHRNRDHLAGREKCLAGIAIDHRPEQRGEHEKHADNAEDNGRVREEHDLDQDEDDAEHEKGDDFPARQPSQIVAQEKKRETNRGKNPGQTRARNLEFEIRANDSEEKKQGRELR